MEKVLRSTSSSEINIFLDGQIKSYWLIIFSQNFLGVFKFIDLNISFWDFWSFNLKSFISRKNFLCGENRQHGAGQVGVTGVAEFVEASSCRQSHLGDRQGNGWEVGMLCGLWGSGRQGPWQQHFQRRAWWQCWQWPCSINERDESEWSEEAVSERRLWLKQF